MIAFSAGERGLSVEPVWTSRLTMSGRKSSVAFGPLRKAICTMRPPSAAAA